MWIWIYSLDLLWLSLRFARRMDLGDLTGFAISRRFVGHFPLRVDLPRKSAAQLIDTLHIFLIFSGYTQSGYSWDALVHRDPYPVLGFLLGVQSFLRKFHLKFIVIFLVHLAKSIRSLPGWPGLKMLGQFPLAIIISGLASVWNFQTPHTSNFERAFRT
jgi:hypothetical protein